MKSLLDTKHEEHIIKLAAKCIVKANPAADEFN